MKSAIEKIEEKDQALQAKTEQFQHVENRNIQNEYKIMNNFSHKVFPFFFFLVFFLLKLQILQKKFINNIKTVKGG